VSRADQLRAELELLDLEEQFVAAKESGDLTTEMKLELREKRRAFREARSGGAVAAPDPVRVTTKARGSE
jgi:hypothetical protein